MKSHRFILEPYKGSFNRYCCPNCNKKRSFSRYLDSVTGQYIHPLVGRCNRENKCGYHFPPREYFKNMNLPFNTFTKYQVQKPAPELIEEVTFVPQEIVDKSLSHYEENNLFRFLTEKFGQKNASELTSKYLIGTTNYYKGGTVFWQKDINERIRTGKIILYNSYSGKRINEPRPFINWAHKLINVPNFHLSQCLFGEHLLKEDPEKNVGLVESEKTAIIASLYLPEMIWVAVGGVNNLNQNICGALKNRNVILFPDLNCYPIWNNKLEELSKIGDFQISSYLEDNATPTEKEHGLDIADYLLREKWQKT